MQNLNKIMHGIAGIMLATALVFTLAACGGGTTNGGGPRPITIAAIGVTAPVTGETPATTITETAQYTGTVTWPPAVSGSGTFTANTAYTATITLTALTGYTLQGVAAGFFTVPGATTVTNAANSGTITAVFPKTGGTDLEPDPIAFDDDSGNIIKTYGDAVFTNAVAAGYSGSGAITYSSSDTTIAAVDGSGQVTILKAGSAVITAEKEADAVYAHAQTSYTLTVNPKPVTITGLSADNKVYDGTTEATVTGTAAISGLISGDTVTVSAGTAAFADKNAGNGKAVTFNGYSLSGADAGNYIFSAQPTATANITAKSVTITGLSAANKQYDGTATATVTGAAGISGLVSGDTVTVSAGTAAFANATVGNGKTVTFSGYSLGGADADNYILSAQPVSVTANIEYVSMVPIPAGTFMMGSPSTEPGRQSNETQHSVTLTKNFSMSKYQVTQALYELVVGTNPSSFSSSPQSGEIQSKRPVEYVTWYDAVEFCNKLSVLEGRQEVYAISGRTPESGYPITGATVTADFSKNGYRLPTEAEWEYACRAGTTTAYNTGDTIGGITGWYTTNSGSKTHGVGLKPANTWGLYDMHGNVWEWCWDWYDSSYYSSSPTNDPMGASSGTDRVYRGGGWGSLAGNLRSAFRGRCYPYDRYSNSGFRLVRS